MYLKSQSIGFILDEDTKAHICTITALTEKWFMTSAKYLYEVELNQLFEDKTYSINFAGDSEFHITLQRNSIKKTKYWRIHKKESGEFKDTDIGVFKVSIFLYSYSNYNMFFATIQECLRSSVNL